ncbi:penicillin-binding protein 2 [Candidatus Saccharibacteria bacterium]|nr:penicillin-binding protein 2 [Candidatus Saccharibacteria bacterium]
MDRSAPPRPHIPTSSNRRLQVWYGVLFLIIAIIITRLFYLQIVRHDHYQQAALNDQQKQYSIASERGTIKAHQGSGLVPLVLNEKLYTLYADPSLVKHPTSDSQKLATITKGDSVKYAALMKTKDSRYQILGKRFTPQQKTQIEALKLPGVGLQAQDYRTYPQGTLAAQLLGFVNNDGQGNYGIEQALNKQLTGTPGMLKAITDASGVPLAASRDNVQVDPKAGDNVVLTINLAMQKELESYLKQGIERAKTSSASALIMDPNTGAILAMANLPTYNPAQYYNATDASVFTNAAVSSPLEVGSIMKVLTTTAALDQGVIAADTSYNDPGSWLIDGSRVKNVEEDGGPGRHNIAEVLNLSMNTGATWMLMQMGGGQLNQKARDQWHDYLTNHFRLGKSTGIEQGYEANGYIPAPDKGDALNLTYANTAFGQAMTATPLQMAAALSAAINGGNYYRPHLVDQTVASNGKTTTNKPEVVKSKVVSPKVSSEIQSLMEYVVAGHLKQGFPYLRFPDNYSVGGKTGTAEIADPNGGYYGDRFNGTYIGFVGGDKPQYVISVRVSEPHNGGYAGSTAAQPIFADLAHMLINNFNVTPKAGS